MVLSELLVSSRRVSFALCLLIGFFSQAVPAQTLGQNREMGRIMLGVIKNDIKKNYYDPTFHGIDIDAKFSQTDEKIKQASSLNEVLGLIAAAVMALNDSHTYFIPPMRGARVEHGWQMQMIGDQCYIVALQQGSDAEAKGLMPGDRVLTVDGVTINRKVLPSLLYIFYLLSPRTGMDLVVETPKGERRHLMVEAKVYQGKSIINLQTGMASDRFDLIRESETLARLYRHRYYEIGNDALLWKMPQFDLDDPKVDELMAKAKQRKALILDLRGNEGGSESTLLRMLANVFDHDVKVGELKRRSETKPLVAKSRGKESFTGKLVVLIDSRSSSAAEIFARTIQTEKRGMVIGDRSAGLVMRGKTYEHQFGQNLLVYYGMVVTDADLINPDGKSLEHVGVTPDEVILPTAADLVSGRDPVLAKAAQLAGLVISPEKAGTLFPIEWRK
jgi:C-terminal processing protease CtpA/Prc